MKSRSQRFNYLSSAYILSGLTVALSAAPIVWDGDTSTDFANGENWSGGVAPTKDADTDISIFNGVSTFQPDLSTGNYTVNGLDFQSGGWTLSGSSGLWIGSGGITSTGDNLIIPNINQSNAATYSSAAGGTLELNRISGNGVTFGTATNTGSIILSGETDNPSFSPTVAFGTLVLNKQGNAGSSANNVTVDSGATLQFGSNLTSRTSGGGRGQIYGITTLNGTMDLNGQGLTIDDTNNWSMGGLSGSGTVTNNGSGSAQLRIKGGSSFSGSITDGASTTAMIFQNDYQLDGTPKTYTGGTTIDGAEVILNMGSVADGLGTGDITLINGGHFKNRNNNPTINNNIVLGTGGGGIESGWGNGQGGNRGITVNGKVSGTEQLTFVNDGGWVRLENTENNYSGGTLNRGYVMANSGAFGTGDITLDGDGTNRGGIQNRNGYDVHSNNLIVAAGGGLLKAGWNNNLEFSGVVSGSGRLRIQEDSGYVVLSNAANSFSGDITFDGGNSRIRVHSLEDGSYTGTTSGAGTIDFAGSGTQVLASSSTLGHTGSTTVSDTMNLQVNGDMSSSQIFVRDGATVGGIGTLGLTTIEPNGKIAPGQSAGVLSTGNLSLQALAVYEAEINGTTAGVDHDQIAVTGTVDVSGSTLNAILSGTYTFGDEFILIENDGTDAIVGNFDGIGEGSVVTTNNGFDVIALYGAGDGNDFALGVVPEPSSALLAGIGALALIRRRRA